ncbi:MAG: M14 family metallopeptidase [Bacteroidota bacterium]|nr:M14 family metallopeptidase [Bacteroidota bacterium]
MKKHLNLLLACLMLGILSTGSLFSQDIEVPLRFDRYYTYQELNQALKQLNKTYPGLTHLDLVGKSDEGREIWSLTIHNPKTGPEADKPAIYVDGNIHGNEIQASEVALYFLDYVLKNYGTNSKVTEMLDRVVIYCIPSVNVDGRVHFMEDGSTASSSRGLRIPKDDDRDGLFDEDPSDDLDKDGNITRMRKKVPFGEYRLDPVDPRIMIRVKEGEIGDYTILGSEGIDNDGDGRMNEDGDGYVDGNRNWGFNWQPNYVQRGGGSYPFEGTGMRAIGQYLVDRPNILMVWAFHNAGGMFLRGPNHKGAKEFDRRDIQVLDYLGKHAEKMVPGYRYLVSWKDLYATWGDFGDFTDNVVGAFTFIGELFQSNTESYRSDTTKPGARADRDKERMNFNDYLTSGQMFVDWKPYNHPAYGEIEIGGWTKYTSRLPQPFMIMDMVHRNAMAVFETACQLPEIRLEVFEKKKIDKDLYQVRVRLVNSKAISSITYQAVRDKIHPQDQLLISGKNIEVLAGGRLTDPYTNKVSYKEHKAELQFMHIPGFGRLEYQFIVKGKGKIKLEYKSIKATGVVVEIML